MVTTYKKNVVQRRILLSLMQTFLPLKGPNTNAFRGISMYRADSMRKVGRTTYFSSACCRIQHTNDSSRNCYSESTANSNAINSEIRFHISKYCYNDNVKKITVNRCANTERQPVINGRFRKLLIIIGRDKTIKVDF